MFLNLKSIVNRMFNCLCKKAKTIGVIIAIGKKDYFCVPIKKHKKLYYKVNY